MKSHPESHSFIIAITAPSGTGKTSVIRCLLENQDRLRYSISDTTRPKRPNEIDGRHYFFITEQEFSEKLERKEFAEHAEVHGYHYGTLVSRIDENLKAGYHVVMDVDVQGAKQLRKSYPDSIYIFLMPPNKQELIRRLKTRGTEVPSAIERRLHDSIAEIESLHSFDYLVVNEKLEITCAEISKIIVAEELKVSRVVELQALIKSYLSQ